MNDQPARAMPTLAISTFVFGLLVTAAVPGAGFLYGQFVETIVLCVGGAALALTAVVVFNAMNARIAALEQRLASGGR